MMFKTHLLFRWVDELIRHPKVLDAVEDILGPNLLAWNTHFFIKEPGDERYVAWHQDLTYWNLDPAKALTAWIALSPSTPKSGAMRMVPGTHTREVVPHLDTWKKGAMLTRGQEIAVEVDEDKIGRAHVLTPVTHAQLVCRLWLENNTTPSPNS